MNPKVPETIKEYSAMADSLHQQGQRLGVEDMRLRILTWANDNAKAIDQAGLTASLLKAIL